MTIKGLGTDILKVSRFEKVLKKHSTRFLKRLFSSEETDYCNQYKDRVQHLAGRFSAKEAVSKALGCGFGKKLSFQDIIIENNTEGKPVVRFSKRVIEQFNNPQIEVSISHCVEYTTATAVWS